MLRGLPIFITGFERSGTTLLRRLVSMNPMLEHDLIHEGRKLLQYRTPGEARLKYIIPSKQAGKFLGSYSSIKAGEKIPYIESKPIIQYIKTWKQWWPDSIIFHIIRDGKECADSMYRTFGKNKEKSLSLHKTHVPIVSKFLEDQLNVYSVLFSKLLDEPSKELKRIYAIIGHIPEQDCINKILNTREPWRYNNKIMCGLRYFDTVGK